MNTAMRDFFRSWKFDLGLLAIAAITGWCWLIGPSHPDFEGRIAKDNRVVMYSLLRCPKCWAMKAQLAAAGIDYEEVRIDEDSPETAAFWEMLRHNGVNTEVIGTPMVLVNDVLLLNGPSFEEVVAQLRLEEEGSGAAEPVNGQ